MSDLYDEVDLSVRADLVNAHLETIKEWARPGNNWSGSERLAIVSQVRRARAADELPPWVGPTTVDGLIDDDEILPAAAIDAVWRLAVHPGTLTKEWYHQIIERGLSPEQYVELVSIVATATCLEVFAQAIGAESTSLPGPVKGHPDGLRGAAAQVSTHWVPTVGTGGANVGRALTAVPVAVKAWSRLSDAQYVPREALIADLSWSRGALDRMQVELLAARTSLLNECFY
ncbi:MAG: alkylhydroperoxidase-related (seleno)protein [Acidimicrobiales bacterium]